jgi:hypothetical protein
LLQKIKIYFGCNDTGTDEFTAHSLFYEEITKLCSNLFPSNYYNNDLKKSVSFFSTTYKQNPDQIKQLLNVIDQKFTLTDVARDGFLLVRKYLNNYSQFLPLLFLDFCKDKIKSPYGNSYMITTFEFDFIKQMYADSFEWLCKLLPIYIGVENIKSRGKYDSFPNKKVKNKKNSSLDDFIALDNGTRKVPTPHLLVNFICFSNNQLRNAINHYKTNSIQ